MFDGQNRTHTARGPRAPSLRVWAASCVAAAVVAAFAGGSAGGTGHETPTGRRAGGGAARETGHDSLAGAQTGPAAR